MATKNQLFTTLIKIDQKGRTDLFLNRSGVSEERIDLIRHIADRVPTYKFMGLHGIGH